MASSTVEARSQGRANTERKPSGTSHSGGGDTLVMYQFLPLGELLASSLRDGMAGPLEISEAQVEKIHSALSRIQESMSGKDPLVVFTKGETVPCFGAEKEACTSESGHIQFARDPWLGKDFSVERRLELVTIELFRVGGVDSPYEQAHLVSSSLSFLVELRKGKIQKVPLNSLHRRIPDGMRCAGQEQCASGYCYSVPELGHFCVNRELNCARPGGQGVYFGETYSLGRRNYYCKPGVGLELR